MNRLNTIISSMSQKDLKSVEKDLYEGNIGKLIKNRLNEFESDVICPTCGNIENKARYTLIFGRDDFKKKANFCGLDCLRFFVEKLEKERSEIVR